METEDIVQRIAISGQEDIIAALGEIGTAGEEAFKRLGDALGVGGEIFAGLIAGITGVGAALGILAESGAASAHALENLSVQSGASVEDISAMGGALASVGAETEGLSFAFRRMGLAITSTWDQIQKDVRDRADLIIADSIKVKETALSFEQAQFEAAHFDQKEASAQLTFENAKLGVWSAQLALQKELARQGKGAAPTSQEEDELKLLAAQERVKAAKQAQIEADLRLQQLARDREQAELKVAQAALAAREAQKKAIEDQRNDINTLVTEVGKVADGYKTLQDARGAANLNIENIMKGIIGSTGPAADAIQNFNGNLIQLAVSSPKVLDVMKKTADFLKNSGDAAANAAIGMREFGRGSGTLVVALQQLGSAGLDDLIKKFKDLGFATSDNDIKISKEFTKTLETLRFELTALKDQISTAFQPVIGEGLAKFQTFIENNRQAIVDFAATVAEQARPVILDFFSIISGEKATQTTWVQPLVDGIKKVVAIALDAGKAIGAIFIGVTGGNLGEVSPENDWLKKWVDFGEGIRKAISFVVDAFKLLMSVTDDVGKAFSNITGIKFSGGEIIAGVVALTTVFVTLRGAIGLAAAALDAFLVLSGAKALLSGLAGRGAAGAAAGAGLAGAGGAAAGAGAAAGEAGVAGGLAGIAARLGPAFARFVSITSLPLGAAIAAWTLFPSLSNLSKENASGTPETEEGLVKGLHSDIKAPLSSSTAGEPSEDYTPPSTPLPRPRPTRRDRSKPVDENIAPSESESRINIIRGGKTSHYNVRKEGFETPEEIEARGTSLPAHEQKEDEIRIIKDNKATYQKIQLEKKSDTQTAAASESGAGGGGASASVRDETSAAGNQIAAAGDQIATAADKQIAALNANTEAHKLKANEKPPLESVNKPTGDLTSQAGTAIPSAPEGPVQARGQNLIDDFVDRLIGREPKDRISVSEKPKAEPIQFPNIPTGFSTEQVNNFTKSVSDTGAKVAAAASEMFAKFLPKGLPNAPTTLNAPTSQIQPATGPEKPAGAATSSSEGEGPSPTAGAPQTPATPAGGRAPLQAAPIVLEIASAVAGQLSLPFGRATPPGQAAVVGEGAVPPPNASATSTTSDITRERERTTATSSSDVQSSATESILQRVFTSVTEKASEFGSKLVESVKSAETILNNLAQGAGAAQKGAVGVPQTAEGNATSALQVEKAAGEMFDAIVAKAESTMGQLRAILNQPAQIRTSAASGSQDSSEGHESGGLVNPIAGVSTIQISAGMANGGLIRSTSSVQNMHITQGEPAITFAAGGVITGAGGPKDDRVPIHASPGEYVVQAHAVQAYGVPFMHAINNETAPKSERHAEGGVVVPAANISSSHVDSAISQGGPVDNSTTTEVATDVSMATGGIVAPTIHSESNSVNSTFADGGVITGAGGPKDDKVPIQASAGEYVVQADAVKHYGVPAMDAINTQTASIGGKDGKQGQSGQSGDKGGQQAQDGQSGGKEGGVYMRPGSNYAQTSEKSPGDGGIYASNVYESNKNIYAGNSDIYAPAYAEGGLVSSSNTTSHGEFAIGKDGSNLGDMSKGVPTLPEGAQTFAGDVVHNMMGGSNVMQAIQNFTSGSMFGRMADAALPSESAFAFQGPARSDQPEKLGTVDMRTNFGDFQAQMNRNQVREMSDKSTQAKISRGGRRQSWFQG